MPPERPYRRRSHRERKYHWTDKKLPPSREYVLETIRILRGRYPKKKQTNTPMTLTVSHKGIPHSLQLRYECRVCRVCGVCGAWRATCTRSLARYCATCMGTEPTETWVIETLTQDSTRALYRAYLRWWRQFRFILDVLRPAMRTSGVGWTERMHRAAMRRLTGADEAYEHPKKWVTQVFYKGERYTGILDVDVCVMGSCLKFDVSH